MTEDVHRVDAWKARGVATPVRCTARTGNETRAEVYVRALGNGERVLRAATVLGTCWALAAVSILIPVAHFALVPGFVLAGPLAAWFRYRPRRIVLGGAGPCPACGEELVVPVQAEHWPLSATCDRCREHVEIRPP